VNTEITDINAKAELVFYDGDCSLCTGWASRFERVLQRAGFAVATLQGNSAGADLSEMIVLTPDGRRFGGADGVVQIARRLWWAWPLFALAQIPGMMPLFRAVYHRVATSRHCLGGACEMRKPKLAHHRHGVFFEMP
jgi:predicted DCC family thiol-disulfide oxidoreductase YuxK